MPTRLVASLLVLACLTACSGDQEGDADPAPPPVPIESFAPEGVTIARAEICPVVPDSAVTAAVGKVAGSDHYGNGDRAAITGTVQDVAHEYSCTWAGMSGDTARVWVFAPPITPERAAGLVDRVRRRKGCAVAPGHRFGSPATAALCVAGGRLEASYRGLFGDTWLACAVTTAPGADRTALLARAGTWCVAAATAADTTD